MYGNTLGPNHVVVSKHKLFHRYWRGSTNNDKIYIIYTEPAFTLPVRTPQCGHTVWGRWQKTSQKSALHRIPLSIYIHTHIYRVHVHGVKLSSWCFLHDRCTPHHSSIRQLCASVWWNAQARHQSQPSAISATRATHDVTKCHACRTKVTYPGQHPAQHPSPRQSGLDTTLTSFATAYWTAPIPSHGFNPG